MDETKIYSNRQGHMTNMATTPVYGKNLLLQNQLTNGLETWYVALGTYSNKVLGLTLSFFTARSNIGEC